jgi:hypothetical protein
LDFTAGLPLAMIRHLTWSGLKPGFCWMISAATPETTAAACDVPDMVKKSPLFM